MKNDKNQFIKALNEKISKTYLVVNSFLESVVQVLLKDSLLKNECFGLPKIHILNPKSQCDGIWRWVFWEAIRS